MGLKAIIERDDTRLGRLFDQITQGLIIISILMFCLETLPDLDENIRLAFRVFEVVIVAVFTIEYVLRLWVADRKLGYVFSFFGLVDLVAILPFYLLSGVDLRSLRIFRLLRLVRLLKLFRYSQVVERISRAFEIARDELILFMMATGMMLFLSAVGIYYFENDAQPEVFASVFHALW